MPIENGAVRWFYSRSRRAGVAAKLKDPFRALRYLGKAVRGIREHGREAQELWGVSPFRQILAYMPLYFRFGHSIDEFYFYRLCSPEWRRYAALFLPWRRMTALECLYETIGVDVNVLQDKGQFARRCVARELPVIPTILELDQGNLQWSNPSEPSLPPIEIVVKPRDGRHARGVRAYAKVPGGYRGEDSEVVEAPTLIEAWATESHCGSLIVQPRVRNAKELSAWSEGALCSVRLVTTRRSPDPPVPLAARFRMPRADKVADNLNRGGIASIIDLASGELGPAQAFDVSEVMRGIVYDRHPQTGQPIAGRRLPRWEDVIALGVKAHEQFEGFHSIGWDIAITSDGPLLIEGNHDWGVRFVQYQGPTPLGRTRFPEDLRDRFKQRRR